LTFFIFIAIFNTGVVNIKKGGFVMEHLQYNPKDYVTTYVIFVVGGFFGAHKFYLGYYGAGIIMVLCGLICVLLTPWFLVAYIPGLITDIYYLNGQIEEANERIIRKRIGGSTMGAKIFSSHSNPERIVLNIARSQGGRITILDVVIDSVLLENEVERVLDKLCARGIAEVNVSDDGLIVYEFPNFRANRETHKGILERDVY